MSALLEKQSVLAQAVIKVGDGRGFVVAHRGQLVVITAAHCLPCLPPPHSASFLEERTFQSLLAPQRSEPTVSAECLFVDPIADIAVLGAPDDQELSKQAAAYEELMASSPPLAITDAPKQGRERVHLPSYTGGDPFEIDTPGRGTARLLSLEGEWINRSVLRRRSWLSVEGEALAGGMSGSPILSMDGKAIALVSTDERNPVLRDSLPAWFFRR